MPVRRETRRGTACQCPAMKNGRCRRQRTRSRGKAECDSGRVWPASVRCRGWSRVVESRLAEWRRLLRSSTTQDARSCNECSEDASLFAHGGRSRLQVRCRDPFRQAVLWSRGSETDVDQSLVRGQGSNRTTGHLSTAIGEGFWPKRRTDTRKTALTVQGLVGLQGLTWNQIQPFLRDLEALRGAA